MKTLQNLKYIVIINSQENMRKEFCGKVGFDEYGESCMSEHHTLQQTGTPSCTPIMVHPANGGMHGVKPQAGHVSPL